MKKNYLKIHKGQYLKDIIDHLISNRIYFKILTGIGATTLEIQTERWSIIIEPNVPVIKGKTKKNKNILGVYEGVGVGDIMNYLNNKKYPNKKIMVTPESFSKIKDACERLVINIYKQFFLLFDECDRTMKDVSFRENIILPMDDFFLFKNKAFISATAVIPSDPRFIDQNFELVYIEPVFDYKKDIDVVITNNVSLSLKTLIEQNRDHTICVFLNHVNAIKSAINDLSIKNDSVIFCSSEKASPLKSNGYNAFEHFEERRSQAINFFTSRFNSAVDIDIKQPPLVILVTNLYYAHHTMIDPSAEAVQIVGRFRNGTQKLFALTNIDPEISAKSESESLSFLEGCEDSFNTIKTLRNSATENSGAREVLEEALKLVTFSKFVNEDGTKNHYMFDNYIYEETVKQYFRCEEKFKQGYRNDHFRPTFFHQLYALSDNQYKTPKDLITIYDQAKAFVTAINSTLSQPPDMLYFIDNREAVRLELQKAYPLYYKAFFVLGQDEFIKNATSKLKIEQALKKAMLEMQKSNFPFLTEVILTFNNLNASGETIISKLKTLIAKHQLDLKPEIKLLNDYFWEVKRTSLDNNQKIKIYKISNPKFNTEKTVNN